MWQYLFVFLAVILLMSFASGLRENLRISPSYDIRGDPYIPFHQVSPWLNPGSLPYRNRGLSDIE